MKKKSLIALLLISISPVGADTVKVATLSAGAATLSNGSVVNIGQPFVGRMVATDGTMINAGIIPAMQLQPDPVPPVVLTWESPGDIFAGTPLGDAQLDATANVQGSFSYSPGAGTILPVGRGQPLTVTFQPSLPQSIAATKTVHLNVLALPTFSSATITNGMFKLTLPSELGHTYIVEASRILKNRLFGAAPLRWRLIAPYRSCGALNKRAGPLIWRAFR